MLADWEAKAMTERSSESARSIESSEQAEKAKPVDVQPAKKIGSAFVEGMRRAFEELEESKSEDVRLRDWGQVFTVEEMVARIKSPSRVYMPVEISSGSLEDQIALTISRAEFDELTAKSKEVLAEAGLAQQRIAKDQEEINILKTETRERLKRLRVA
jgi:hypothetical protein